MPEEGRWLSDVADGTEAVIRRVPDGDPELLRYLASLGIVPDQAVVLVGRAPFEGPVTSRSAACVMRSDWRWPEHRGHRGRRVRVTRRRLLAGAPIVASAPLASIALADAYGADGHMMDGHMMSAADMAAVHTSMIGDAVPAPDGPDVILEPPRGYEPGPVRVYDLVASERTIEVAKGVYYAAWAYGLAGEDRPPSPAPRSA